MSVQTLPRERNGKGAKKITAKLGLLMLIGLASVASGCGVAPLAQYAGRRFFREAGGIRYDAFLVEPAALDLGAYDRLVVYPLENQMEDQIPAELVTALNEKLSKQLNHALGGKAAGFRKGEALKTPEMGVFLMGFPAESLDAAEHSTVVEDAAASPVNEIRTVILHAAIVDFFPGKQSLRVLQIGVGRQAVLTLHMRFVDEATGRLIGRYVVNSEIYRLFEDSSALPDKLAGGIGELVSGLIDRGNRDKSKQ